MNSPYNIIKFLFVIKGNILISKPKDLKMKLVTKHCWRTIEELYVNRVDGLDEIKREGWGLFKYGYWEKWCSSYS